MKITGRRILMFVALGLVAMVCMGNTSGCSGISEEQQAAFNRKIQSIDRLLHNQPATTLNYSMDRYLMDQRNVRFNDPNKMCYLYINTFDGSWLKVTIVGKVASTSKRLSTPFSPSTCAPSKRPVPSSAMTLISTGFAPG